LSQAKSDVLILLAENDELKTSVAQLQSQQSQPQTQVQRAALDRARNEQARAEQELVRLRAELHDALSRLGDAEVSTKVGPLRGQGGNFTKTDSKNGSNEILAQRLAQSEEVIKHLEQQVCVIVSSTKFICKKLFTIHFYFICFILLFDCYLIII
jgi:hypothetical protein